MLLNETTLSFTEDSVRIYLNHLIQRAVRARASDIHLEPLGKDFCVRFRIDGVLQHIETLDAAFYPSLISILKLIATLDIAQKRLPQDGRCKWSNEQNTVEMRISVLPSIFGESLALRLLKSRKAYNSFSELGFIPQEEDKLKNILKFNDGLTVIAGSTGVGKTTTLYTILNQLDHLQKKIITVEDPIEMTLKGVNQVAVNYAVGLTFAVALRSILRQSPDIIMIGEVRDQETAQIALNAASTGHQVLTTLHADTPNSALVRLIELSISPFLLAEYLRGIITQRLVRRWCNCDFEDRDCKRCQGIGYYGRIGLYHVLMMTREIQKGIAERRSILELDRLIACSGQGSLLEVANTLIAQGLTSVSEIEGVV